MDWVAVSLAGAAAFALVSILDKVLLVRFVPNARAFIVMVGLIQFPVAALALPFSSFEGIGASPLVVGYFSGFLWGISLVAMFGVMSTQDVSRVVPVISTSPVFVAILAVIFLSESLSPLHWVAILATVAGAGLISLRSSSSSGRVGLGPSFFVLLLGSIALAGGQFLSKVALDDMDVATLLVTRSAGLGMAAVILPFRPSVVPLIRRAVTDPPTLAVFVMAEGFVVLLAMVLTLWAIGLGPVSLVATAMATRPLFVFAMSVALSSSLWPLLNEPLDRRTLLHKLASTGVIVGGIAGISLA